MQTGACQRVSMSAFASWVPRVCQTNITGSCRHYWDLCEAHYKETYFVSLVMVAVWRSVSALASINVVDLRRARLVLGWATVRWFDSSCYLGI